MEAVKRGGDRQELHEHIREHSMEAAKKVKLEGESNDLIERIKGDSAFASVKDDIDSLLDANKFTGRCASQVSELYEEYIKPILEANKDKLNKVGEVKV
jgi:adenylosuccinate lyase